MVDIHSSNNLKRNRKKGTIKPSQSFLLSGNKKVPISNNAAIDSEFNNVKTGCGSIEILKKRLTYGFLHGIS